MLVDLGYIMSVKKRFRQINAEDIKNIQWVLDGKEIEFAEEDLKNFEFMGLNNTDINLVFGFSPVEDNNEKI